MKKATGFFHGSPDAPAVDIAVTNGPVLIADVPCQMGSEYIEVPAGTYDLEARIAGTGDAATAELPAWGNTQLNSVFANEAPVVGAYIDVWTETEGAAFTACGSVLDNATSDPTTVLPQ